MPISLEITIVLELFSGLTQSLTSSVVNITQLVSLVQISISCRVWNQIHSPIRLLSTKNMYVLGLIDNFPQLSKAGIHTRCKGAIANKLGELHFYVLQFHSLMRQSYMKESFNMLCENDNVVLLQFILQQDMALSPNYIIVS